MCNNQTVPSVSLQTAVLMQVTEFAKNGKSFSIREVTGALREKVNNGELEIPEIEEQGPTFRFNVRHSNVRALFRDMLNTGVFDQQFKLEETFPNGKFFVYVPTVTSMTSATQQTSMSAATTQAPASPVAAPFVKPTRDEIVKRVKLYVTHCRTRNFRPSLKKVQSAIKRRDRSTGWTCEELSDVITNDIGFNIIPDPDCVSTSQVEVV